MGVRGKVEQLVDSVIAASSITIQERRSADGLDAHVPMILRDGALYDPDLDRFLRDFLSMAFAHAIPFVPMATTFSSGLVFFRKPAPRRYGKPTGMMSLPIIASAAAPRSDNAFPPLRGIAPLPVSIGYIAGVCRKD